MENIVCRSSLLFSELKGQSRQKSTFFGPVYRMDKRSVTLTLKGSSRQKCHLKTEQLIIGKTAAGFLG